MTLDPREGIDDNRSIWWANAEPAPPPQPSLTGTTAADVAVIGGGFTGVSTAYHIARRFPERRVVLLEAKRIANGASGRNGGLMLTGINGAHGGPPELEKRIYDVTREGIDLVEGLVREHALDVRMRRAGALEAFTDARRAEDAARAVEALAAAGLPLRFLAGRELHPHLRAEGVVGAVLDPHAGQLDGVSFLRAMLPVLLRLGVEVFEGTPVLRVEEGRPARLETPAGEVRAAAIVLGTNAYTPALGYFRRGLFPLHSHIIATAPLDPDARDALGWGSDVAGFSDDLDRLAYGSMTAAGEIVFGGGGNAAYAYRYGGRTRWDGDATRSFAAIERRLRGYFPRAAGARIAHRWTGPVALTLSRVCSIGVTGERRNVLYAVGYSGHGIALANLAGKVLCDIYSDDDARWRDLPFYQQRLLPMPPEPLRWLGYHTYTALTGRSPRRAFPLPRPGR